MKEKNVWRILSVVLIFFTIYKIELYAFPVSLNRLMHILCLLIYVFSIFKRKLYREEIQLLFISFLYVFAAFSVALFHNTSESLGVNFALEMYMILPVGFVLNKMYKNYMAQNEWGQYSAIAFIFDSIVYANLIQVLISFVFFFDPSLFDLYSNYVVYGRFAENKLLAIERRMMGVGQEFFGAVLNYSVALLVLVLLPSIKNSCIYKKKMLYMAILVLTAIAAILSGRTSFITIVILLIFSIWYYKLSIKKVLLYSLSLLIFVFSFIFVFKNYIDASRIVAITDWAFEMFYSDKIGFESTGSSEHLLSMWKTDFSYKTFLWGDGLFFTPLGFYKDVDVGYLRILFYGGIFYLIFVLLFETYFVQLIYRRRLKEMKYFLLLMSILFLVFNVKGIALPNIYLLLLFYPSIYYKYNT